MRGVIVVGRIGEAGRRLTRRLLDDFPTTVALLLLRISLPVLKRVIGVRRLARWLSVVSAPSGARYTGEARAERINRAMETIQHGGRLLIAGNCLDRSLAAYWMLRRAGAAPKLVLGAKHEHGALAGHAWIELGAVALEPRAEEFVRIATIDGD